MEVGDKFNPKHLFYGIQIPNCILKIEGLSPIAKLCWGRLLQYAGDDGLCFPKQETLASEIGVSLSSIQRVLKELVEYKLINIEKPKGKEKLLHLNHKYYFIWHSLYDYSDMSDRRVGDMSDRRVVINNNHNSNNNHKEFNSSKEELNDGVVQSSFNNHSDKKRKAYPIDITTYPTDVQNLYELWQSLGSPIKQHKNGSKTNYDGLCALKKAIKLYDPNKIADAMILYHKVISSAQDYKLTIKAPGHLIGLNEFFRFSDFTRTRIDKGNIVYDIQSWCDECIKGELYIDRVYAKHSVEDTDPEITESLKKYWKKYLNKEVPKSPNDEDCFRLATQRFKQFMKKHRKNYRLYDNIDIDNLKKDSKYLFEALINSTDDLERVTPAWLCSEGMFKKRLPFYLVDQGMMDNEFGNEQKDTSNYANELFEALGG